MLLDALLRPWSDADAADLVAVGRESPDLERQLGPVPEDAAAARALIVEHLLDGEAALHRAVVVGGRVVGNVGLGSIESRHGTAWASYWLASSVRGQGLAARGLAAVAVLGFERGLFRLELGHRTNNPASCRVAHRAAFRPEGIERQKLRYGDERFDVELHARLATDPGPEVVPLAVAR